MVPDVLARDPRECPVWEITGAEFSKAELHTAAGISIRYQRASDYIWSSIVFSVCLSVCVSVVKSLRSGLSRSQ